MHAHTQKQMLTKQWVDLAAVPSYHQHICARGKRPEIFCFLAFVRLRKLNTSLHSVHTNVYVLHVRVCVCVHIHACSQACVM